MCEIWGLIGPINELRQPQIGGRRVERVPFSNFRVSLLFILREFPFFFGHRPGATFDRNGTLERFVFRYGPSISLSTQID